MGQMRGGFGVVRRPAHDEKSPIIWDLLQHVDYLSVSWIYAGNFKFIQVG